MKTNSSLKSTPATFSSLQKMARKITTTGGLELGYEDLHQGFSQTYMGMVLDGVLEKNSSLDDFLLALPVAVHRFTKLFPQYEAMNQQVDFYLEESLARSA